MSRKSFATPCPAPTLTSAMPRRLSTASTSTGFGDDTCTEDIDYTRAIQQEFKNARPRRRSMFQRKTEKNVGITIFEDVVEDQELVVDQARLPAKTTLLGKPAQKRQTMGVKRGEEWMGAQPLDETGPRRRTSLMPAQESVQDKLRPRNPKDTGGALKKDPRRRTIYVPPDDTTILTIHPGANTTDRLNDTFQLRNITTHQPIMPPQIADEQPKLARKPRMSFAVAPKRVPLQQISTQSNLPNVDAPGQNGGKENMLPEMEAGATDKKPAEFAKPAEFTKAHSIPLKDPVSRSRLFEPTAASQARQTVVARKAVPLVSAQNASATDKKVAIQRMGSAHRRQAAPNQSLSLQQQRIPSVSTLQPHHLAGNAEPDSRSGRDAEALKRKALPRQITTLHRVKHTKVSQYPILSEDVRQPQLYEESWLNHQEIALTELVNEVFLAADQEHGAWHTHTQYFRELMLENYHQPTVANLHQRIQSSLLYGALSRSKASTCLPNPANDIGLRKRFLNLWLNTYEEQMLCAAVEVVVGRQIPRKAYSQLSSLDVSEGVLDPLKSRREVVGFLETFLVSVDDVGPSDWETGGSSEDQRWRKMVLRSMMLIWLLDHAKSSGAVSGCLFRPHSAFKSSSAVLHALSSMLIPTVGDITRTLRHLEYEVSHVQDPLDEVGYKIENIAVDLRDGIFLTRLVELLLFVFFRQRGEVKDQEATVTIMLPDATMLQSALFAEDGSYASKILSRHLKMPCMGRAQKLHNVQVALSGLVEHGRLAGNLIDDISPDDIVDGHREKTLSLLWSLVSHHGLASLVDWDELNADIKRVGDRLSGNEDFAKEPRESLLKAWADAHCIRKGIQISNFTTSFADGTAYAAILADFVDFLPENHYPSSRHSAFTLAALEVSLRSLGCSHAFIKQLTASNSTIPSRTTTISNLAFLASRLLPLARRHNAAEIIQRVYKRRLYRRLIFQRIGLMRLAHACAIVVQTRNRMVWAAKILQRSWRAVLDARISRLNRHVMGVQALARGWTVRRKVQKLAMYDVGSGKSLRIMGGW